MSPERIMVTKMADKRPAELLAKIAEEMRRSNPNRVAAPISDLLEETDIAPSTYHQEIAEGGGPRTFKIGRRKYVLLTDWHAWLEQKAAAQ